MTRQVARYVLSALIRSNHFQRTVAVKLAWSRSDTCLVCAWYLLQHADHIAMDAAKLPDRSTPPGYTFQSLQPGLCVFFVSQLLQPAVHGQHLLICSIFYPLLKLERGVMCQIKQPRRDGFLAASCLAVICCNGRSAVRTSTIIVAFGTRCQSCVSAFTCMAPSMDLHDRACCDVFCWMYVTFKLYLALILDQFNTSLPRLHITDDRSGHFRNESGILFGKALCPWKPRHGHGSDT
jgi:hypothetical protein